MPRVKPVAEERESLSNGSREAREIIREKEKEKTRERNGDTGTYLSRKYMRQETTAAKLKTIAHGIIRVSQYTHIIEVSSRLWKVRKYSRIYLE